MTNEELAVIIKQGNTQLMERLYLQNKGVIYQYAYWYYTKYRTRCDSSGIVMDDLIQEGYFALCDAVQAYKPESGYKFLTFIKYPIQNRFNALVGYRVKKDLQEPIIMMPLMQTTTLVWLTMRTTCSSVKRRERMR